MPPDPFQYWGPKGLYTLTHYHGAILTPIWAATFLFQCYVSLFRDISMGYVHPNDPYPNGEFICVHQFPASLHSPFQATLKLNKLPARGWRMTYRDLADDVEALWYATLWFQDPNHGLPQMDIVVQRFVSTASTQVFDAEIGRLSWDLYVPTNVSES